MCARDYVRNEESNAKKDKKQNRNALHKENRKKNTQVKLSGGEKVHTHTHMKNDLFALHSEKIIEFCVSLDYLTWIIPLKLIRDTI